MATLPTNLELTGASVTKSQLQTRLGTLRDFIATLLGTDDSTPSASRVLLGVPAVNWLLNPDGEVAQGLPASSSDGDYDFDQWYTVTQTGSVAATQLSNPENGYRHGMRITQSQASAQRMGFCQIIEGKDAIKLRGKTVTFGGRYRISASTNIRLAVLEWTGTEDSPVKDQVNNWASSTYTTGNFFKSTTLTVAGVSSAVAMTANTAANASVSATISASATNIIVMAWTESTQAQNVTFDRWGQRLIEASSLIDYIRRSYAEELTACRRYFERSYDNGVATGSSTETGAIRTMGVGNAAADAIRVVPKRATGTLVGYDAGGNASRFSVNGVNNISATFGGLVTNGLDGVVIDAIFASATSVKVVSHWVWDARIGV